MEYMTVSLPYLQARNCITGARRNNILTIRTSQSPVVQSQSYIMSGDIVDFVLSRRGKTVHSEARKVASNVVRFFDNEDRAKESAFALNQQTKRAESACGFSESFIKRIRKEARDVSAGTAVTLVSPGKHRKRPSSWRNVNIDDFDRGVIRRVIQDFYLIEKIVPTV